MKKLLIPIMTVMMLSAASVQAQQQRNATIPSNSQAKEDFQPNLTNQPGKQYPMVNSEGAVRVQFRAPGATSVQIDLGGRYEMTKDENGVWTGTTRPQDVGFHYYQIIVDGTAMPDPGTVSFFGAGRWGSGIEIPSADMDFWQTKDVPQGSIVEKYYWSKATESMRHCYVYLPNEYEKDPNKKYPVLYLQHGNAENEYGWAVQGAKGLKETAKLIFMSQGSKENRGVVEGAEALNNIGVKAVSYISEGTAHEWHTWRRSLYEFAQLIFK